MILRRALPHEAELCYQFIEDARAYHSSLGFVQWHSGYPTLQTLKDDIAAGTGYVFTVDDQPVGYCCILLGDDPDYAVIDGEWMTDRPYIAVHRMAFSTNTQGSGLSRKAFAAIRDLCAELDIHAIRVDTKKENTVMQHILHREGFEHCGTIFFEGSPRLAYEWDR